MYSIIKNPLLITCFLILLKWNLVYPVLMEPERFRIGKITDKANSLDFFRKLQRFLGSSSVAFGLASQSCTQRFPDLNPIRDLGFQNTFPLIKHFHNHPRMIPLIKHFHNHHRMSKFVISLIKKWHWQRQKNHHYATRSTRNCCVNLQFCTEDIFKYNYCTLDERVLYKKGFSVHTF